MFDNPNQELKRLEDELLKAEMTDEEFERFYDDLFEEFGPVKEKDEDLLEGSPVNTVRNYANGYGSQTRPAAQQRPVQQRPQQAANTQRPQQGYNVQRPQQRTGRQSADQAPAANRYMAPQKKERDIKGLVITACVECAGIAAVVLWWLIRIL